MVFRSDRLFYIEAHQKTGNLPLKNTEKIGNLTSGTEITLVNNEREEMKMNDFCLNKPMFKKYFHEKLRAKIKRLTIWKNDQQWFKVF